MAANWETRAGIGNWAVPGTGTGAGVVADAAVGPGPILKRLCSRLEIGNEIRAWAWAGAGFIPWALLGAVARVGPSPSSQVRGRATARAGTGVAARHEASGSTRVRVEPGLRCRLERELGAGVEAET